MLGRTHVSKVGPKQQMYQSNRHGLVWIENEQTVDYHSCHPYVMSKDGVVKKTKKKHWKPSDRIVQQDGRFYNVDERRMNDQWDRIAAGYCKCEACEERRSPHEFQ